MVIPEGPQEVALCLDGSTVLLLGLPPPSAADELWSALAAVLGSAAVRKACVGLEQALGPLLHGATRVAAFRISGVLV